MLAKNPQYRANSNDIKKELEFFATEFDLIVEKKNLKKNFLSCLIC